MDLAKAADGSPVDILKDFPDSVLIGTEGNQIRADFKTQTCSIQQDGTVERGGDYRRTTQYHQKDDNTLMVTDFLASNMGFGGATAMTEYKQQIDSKTGTLAILDTNITLR